MAPARSGQWKAVEFLYKRIYGRPTEHIVTEQAKPAWKRQMDDLSTDALTRLVHKNNPEAIRRMEEDGTPKRVEDMTPEERDDPLRALTFQPRLRAVEDEPDEEAVMRIVG